MSKLTVTYPKVKNGAGDLGTLTTNDYNNLIASIQQGTIGIITLYAALIENTSVDGNTDCVTIRRANGALVPERLHLDNIAITPPAIAVNDIIQSGLFTNDASYVWCLQEQIVLGLGMKLAISGYVDKTSLQTKKVSANKTFTVGCRVHSAWLPASSIKGTYLNSTSSTYELQYDTGNTFSSIIMPATTVTSTQAGNVVSFRVELTRNLSTGVVTFVTLLNGTQIDSGSLGGTTGSYLIPYVSSNGVKIRNLIYELYKV